MSKRILFGLVAWLLGAATATAGCLLAVSLLGQGIGGGSAQQLTQDAVNRALASEAAESSPAAAPTPPRTVHASTTPASSAWLATTASPATTATPSPSATSAPTASPSTDPTPSATQSTTTSGGTVFTSAGGEVVASCQASGAYLLSWSPLQGYEVDSVSRGPAASARVAFESNTTDVTMTVTCSAGVPSATTSSGPDH